MRHECDFTTDVLKDCHDLEFDRRIELSSIGGVLGTWKDRGRICIIKFVNLKTRSVTQSENM